MRHDLQHGFGLALGWMLCKVMNLVLGLALCSALGLLIAGHWPLALLMTVLGFGLYDGVLWLLRRRG